MRARTALLALFASVALVLASWACVVDNSRVRDLVGQPPDFHNIDETYLQDAMWRLAHGVQDLNTTITATDIDDAAREQRVLLVLDDMARAAEHVNAPGTKRSHKNVAMNIDKLIADIAVAKSAAQAHDLAPARALPASCLGCHEGAGGGAQKK